MGYYTFYNGKAKFELEERYYKFLAYIMEHRLGNCIKLSPGNLVTEEEWKNRGFFFEDMLLFIDRYGHFTELEIYASGEESFDEQAFVLEEGKPKVRYYDFDEAKKTPMTLETVIEYCQRETMESYDFDHEDDTINEYLEDLSNEELEDEDIPEIMAEIYEFIQEEEATLEIDFREVKIQLTKNGIAQIPYEQKEKNEEIALSVFGKAFLLSQYDMGAPSPVMIVLEGEQYPLTSALMKFLMDVGQGENQTFIKAGEEEVTSVCHFCVNRLKGVAKMCGGCDATLLTK